MAATPDPSIHQAAQRWLAADPDPDTAAELQSLLASDPSELKRRFSGRLAFGTAGIRGPMGAGPTRMNRVLVRMVTSALAQRLLQDGQPAGGVVVAHDARHRSREFAADAAGVLAGAGIAVRALAGPVPTPVLAFAVRHLEAAAGVMVTASHNPRADNGYKVYWRGGSLLGAPVDREISRIIDATGPLEVSALAPSDDPAIVTAGEELIEAYVKAVAGLVAPGGARSVRIAYTPLHGVGGETLVRALERAGFDPPVVVADQAQPDPDFPTTPFPNPEETGVLDPLLRLAADTGADVALAHDPDADRLAVAVPADRRWRMLTGDETGCLLAEHLLGRTQPSGRDGARRERPRLVINTVVSSRLLPRIAAGHGADWAETLTGFKWIMNARAQHPTHRLVLGYEDALGYAPGEVVADKDGIGAALVMAEMAAQLKAQGRTLLDLLDDLHRRHGAHATGQRSIRFERTASGDAPMARAMAALRAAPPGELAGSAVTEVHDLAEGSEHLPPADVVILELFGAEARVIVRPSGTEPKMKVYAEAAVIVSDPGADDQLRSARLEARRRITSLLDATVRHVADPERHARALSAATPTAPATTDAPTTARATTSRATAVASTRTASTGLSPGGLPSAGPARPPQRSLEPAAGSRADDLRLVVRCIDLTTLEGDDTPGRIRALCAQALRPDPADPTVGPVAAVCVYPTLAGVAAELLAATPVVVASVAGAFPSGLSPLEVKVAEVMAAVAAGATEIDTVLNRSAFLSGRGDVAATELRALKEAAGPASLKAILEVCELGDAGTVAEATRLAIDAGADMVKTSTGKGASGASPEAVRAMAGTVAEHTAAGGRPVGIKISGGVRTADDALAYVDIVRSVLGPQWLTPDRLRFGASALLSNVVAELTAATSGQPGSRTPQSRLDQ